MKFILEMNSLKSSIWNHVPKKSPVLSGTLFGNTWWFWIEFGHNAWQIKWNWYLTNTNEIYI